MTGIDKLTDLTACPRCDKSPLTIKAGHFRCDACKVDFPSVGEIPWLFAEPEASIGEWRNRLHFALQQLSNRSQGIKAALASCEPDSLTAKRLRQQADAADDHRNKLRELLAPIDIQSSTASYESYLALRTRLPADQGIATYYANLHRDWAWGDEENAASLAQIKAVAGDLPLGDTLVLGSGASRLAYDVHTELDTARTVAMDFNPLLLLAAKSVTEGRTVELYEFPIAPKTLDDFAVRRSLAAPAPAGDAFLFVLGDALRPPFGQGAFDTIVTPWIIDIVNDDLKDQAARINKLLKKGGRWINFGSLNFPHADERRCYSTEETLEIVAASGFGTPATKEASIPYMCSPASRHARRETVFSFAAEKTGNVKAPGRHKALPDWIVTGKEPVPALDSFRTQAMTTQIYTFIMSLIDGKRTIGDMAKLMEQQNLMRAAEAESAIRNFLIRMYSDSERQSNL